MKTFSIGYDEDYASYPSELAVRAPDGRAVGAEHHERILSLDDLLGFLPEMVRLQDEPVADPVCFPLYYVSELARDNGVIVAQAGEGADELFFGYPSWRTLCGCSVRTTCRCPASGSASRRSAAAGRRARARTNTSAAARKDVPVFWGGAEAFTEKQKRRLLVAAAAARARRPDVVGCARADPRAVRERRHGSRRT